jgi:hypothetical protein
VQLSKGLINVWPGYVAAVSSLVLSLLLLAGILVVSISQAGRVVDSYNRKLIATLVADEERVQQLEELRKQPLPAPAPPARALAVGAPPAPPAAPRPVPQTPAPATTPQPIRVAPAPAPAPVPAPAPAPAAPSPAAAALAAKAAAAAAAAAAEFAAAQNEAAQALAALQALDRTLQDRTTEYNRSQLELQRTQAESRQISSRPPDPEPAKVYRLIYAAGTESLDAASLQRLQQQMQRDGALNGKSRWLLEAGTRGMDPAAEREIYRLMLNLRTQLQTLGITPDQIKVVVNRDRSPQDMPGAKGGLRNGDETIILRRQPQTAGTS